MGVKILKFLGAVLILEFLNTYMPYGPMLCVGVLCYAVWKMVND